MATTVTLTPREVAGLRFATDVCADVLGDINAKAEWTQGLAAARRALAKMDDGQQPAKPTRTAKRGIYRCTAAEGLPIWDQNDVLMEDVWDVRREGEICGMITYIAAGWRFRLNDDTTTQDEPVAAGEEYEARWFPTMHGPSERVGLFATKAEARHAIIEADKAAREAT